MMFRSSLAGVARIALTIGHPQMQGVEPKRHRFLYFLPNGSARAKIEPQIASFPNNEHDRPSCSRS